MNGTADAGDWAAPRAPGPVRARVTLPGSKSLTNRYLVLSALASAPSRMRRPLRSRDTQLMAGALRALGARIEDVPGAPPDAPDWLVTPGPLRGDADVDCGLAGTVMRFVPPVAALADGAVRFDKVGPFAESPQFIRANARAVVAAWRELRASMGDGVAKLLFVTHSIPLTMNAASGSGAASTRYEAQTLRVAQKVAEVASAELGERRTSPALFSHSTMYFTTTVPDAPATISAGCWPMEKDASVPPPLTKVPPVTERT